MNSTDHYPQRSIKKCEVNIIRALPTGKHCKLIELMKDELGGNIMTEFEALRPKRYSHSMDDGNSDKKANRTNKCALKQRLKFNYYKNYFLNN